ncbi:MAG: hypothetical protein V1827_03385 [Candidatus Micrarchaeota archaeon]
MDFISEVIGRLGVLVGAPLGDMRLLFAALPLLLATLFMTLYFGKYRKEGLGWNDAFDNTMVFLFVSINLIATMYFSDGAGSWDNVLSSSFYLTTTLVLAGAAFMLMLVTYYHLLPKRIAIFIFSTAPVNVSVYVLMTIIYAGVPPDLVTLMAAILLFGVIFAILRGLQVLESMASKPEGLELTPEQSREEKLLKKLKETNVKIVKEKGKIEKADTPLEPEKKGDKDKPEKPKKAEPPPEEEEEFSV